MTEKSDKELAVDLTIATLENNSKLVSANGASRVGPVTDVYVARLYVNLLAVVQGKANPFADQSKK